MNKLYKILALLLFAPALCLAQKNFKSGYVVNLKGDTIRGLIDYREWDNNPAEINFKADGATSKTTTFSISNAIAFGVNGLETYQRFTVSVSRDGVSPADAVFVRDTAMHLETVFLRTLIKGDNVNLFSYADDVKGRYYFAEKDNAPAELKYWIYKDGSDIKYNKRYRAQLTYLAQKFKPGSPAILQAIAKAEYTENDIVNIIKTVNSTINSQFTSAESGGGQLYIGAGINFSNSQFLNGTIFGNPGTTDTHTPLPYIAVGMNYYVNKLTRKLYFTLDLSLLAEQHKLQATANSSNGSTTVIITNAKVDFNQYTIALSPQIGYNLYSTKNFSIFTNFGFNLNYSGYNDYSYIETNNVNSSTLTVKKFPDFPTIWLTPTFKTGFVLFQKIDVGMQFNLLSLKGDNSLVHRYLLGVHFPFGK
jgi:hypothetical protein